MENQCPSLGYKMHIICKQPSVGPLQQFYLKAAAKDEVQTFEYCMGITT